MVDDETPSRKRASSVGVLFRLVLAGFLWAVVWIAINPERIPAGWSPVAPLRVDDPVTVLTDWRLRRAIADPDACLAALATGADFVALPDFEASPQCYIRPRVDLSGIGLVRMRAVETSCGTALRLAMWELHSLLPAADMLGVRVAEIDHIGSYNCREMRTTTGVAGTMSSHATAGSIDISGFKFADGTDARLIRDWNDGGTKGVFLRAARDGACDWFGQTLSPDYNSLHADHFHLQARGWGTCR